MGKDGERRFDCPFTGDQAPLCSRLADLVGRFRLAHPSITVRISAPDLRVAVIGGRAAAAAVPVREPERARPACRAG